MFRIHHAFYTSAFLILLVSLLLAWQKPLFDIDWRNYGNDLASTKYAPINQIHEENVDELEIAWRWESIDQPILNENDWIWTWKYESTPILVNELLYVSTSLSQVAAINPVSGETVWQYDPESWKLGSPPNNGYLHRGVSYWDDGADGRIFIGTGHAQLIALNAKTGNIITEFNQTGSIDLTQGLGRSVGTIQYGVSSPPLICGDAVIVGSSIWDYPFSANMAPGDVRAFDARTGELRWQFKSIPQGSEFGADTWADESGDRFGNTNVWTTMSCDIDLGLVYLPFGTPSNDYYGGERPGDNLFAESLVAVDLESGERRWHYQMVRHGIWDYDLPAAPNLVDIEVDGRPIKAVAQVSKHGFLFVLDRETGEPVWPIENRAVPASDVPGEEAALTQPFPTRPAPFEQQGATEDDLIDFTPALRTEALSLVTRYRTGPLFTPPSVRGTITVPGVSGGGSWAGAAVHPKTGRIFIPSIRGTWTLYVSRSQGPSTYAYKGSPSYGPMGPQGLPLMKPPYGSITAIDLNTGDHLWKTAVGEGPRNHSSISHLGLGHLGWARRIFVLMTDSLLFATQEGININRGSTPRRNAGEIRTINANPALLSYDIENGSLVGRTTLPSNAAGSPMTYMIGGVQYIVIPVGGASQRAELVAVKLNSAFIEVSTEDPSPINTNIQLAQSYPNPTTDQATLTFELPSSMHVKIILYNALGQQVETLIDEVLAEGSHTKTFDVSNQAAGRYFYRLIAGQQELGGKMIVVR